MRADERRQLESIIKGRRSVAKRVVDQRAAELLADVDAQLAKIYKFDDQHWADVTAAAQRAIEEADREVARRCRDLGIPEEFRPEIHSVWYGRGENAAAGRRSELRRAAKSKITVLAEKARVEIETKALNGLTLLARGALESDEAKAFLDDMPTVEQLMPPLDVAVLPQLGYEA